MFTLLLKEMAEYCTDCTVFTEQITKFLLHTYTLVCCPDQKKGGEARVSLTFFQGRNKFHINLLFLNTQIHVQGRWGKDVMGCEFQVAI